MTKWEYLSITVASTKTITIGNPRVHRKIQKINEIQLENWKEGLPFYEHLNQLGEQGWEMVYINESDYDSDLPGTAFLFFKRRKE